MRKLLCAAALALSGLTGIARADSKPATAPSADRIHYDSQCYTLDGKDTFLYSGSFHYFRCPKPLWAERFEKMKQAGLNCVETYVAWNWHERMPPESVDDFSRMDMSDLADWLDMAINRFGFYVILRPGPYICAEWDGGGYPQWLVTKKPADAKTPWFRSDDPAYLAWCRHWYAAVAKTAVPWQLTHRPVGQPGVILWQIENEYDYAQLPVEEKLHQLQALAHDSRDFGIDVPLITCMTHDPLYRQDEFLSRNVIECRNSYPGFNPASEVRELRVLDTYQPKRPRLVTELQGGWFSDVGKQLSEDMGYTPAQITHVTMLAWALGFTGTNYYMMFGGTNIGDWGSAGRTTTYDYAAAIREWGGVGPRYFAVQAMGRMIQQHGAKLVRTVAQDFTLAQPAPANLTVLMRRAADGSRYLFVLNDNQNDSAKGDLNLSLGDAGPLSVQYDLSPFDAKVFYLPPGASGQSQGEWLPAPVQPPQRPTQIPDAVNIAQGRRQVDPGPVADSWHPIPNGGGVEDAGIFDRRFVFYRATLPATSSPEPLTLAANLPDWAGSMIGQINGAPLDLQRQGLGAIGAALPSLAGNDNQLFLLFENAGRSNGGGDMERKCGPADLCVNIGGFLPRALTDWTMRTADAGDTAPLTAPGLDDSAWKVISVSDGADQVKSGVTAVFRTHLDLTADQLKAGAGTLEFGQISGRNQLYLNGKPIDQTRRGVFDVTAALKEGRNVVAVVVTTGKGAGGIGRGVEIVSSTPIPALRLQWQVSGQTTGAAGRWWETALDDSAWPTVTLGAPADKAESASISLVWYRLHFELPQPDSHVWVPWKLHLSAAGNGFIYLNGHLLGRWWEVGPQYDFYLPECWLNWGPSARNVVAMCLRPTHGPTAVHVASVSPYADFAETR